tara:strand:+ start:154 stop:471 length:318 start_codon:yes stop_codon:yes gene_type:complete
MFFKSELQRTLDNADALDDSNKSIVLEYVSEQIDELIHQEQFYDYDSLRSAKLSEAKTNRQNSISSDEERDVNWVKYALWESYLLANIKDARKIEQWIIDNNNLI